MWGLLARAFRLLGQHAAMIWHNRQLLRVLVRRDVSLRTTNTAMGWVWLVLQPGLQVLAFWFLFDLVLQVRLQGRLPFLDYFLAGIVLWLMIAEILMRSLSVLNDYRSLYQRTPFPVAILPMVPILVSGLIYSVVYGSTMALLGGPVSGLGGVLTVFLVLIWLVPFAYLVAVAGLFLRDFAQVFPFVLTMTLYLTPILYAPSMIPDPLRWVLHINPVADIMATAHFLAQSEPVTTGNLVRPVLVWLVLLVPSLVVFRRLVPHMREAL
jgi:lipopolysaccharide transport system permease protein